MSDDKVIHAFPQKADLPECLVDVERRTSFCAHREKIILVEHDRTVMCSKCEAVLDPFKYLLTEAYSIQRAWQDHRMVAAKVAELQGRINDLEKTRKRLAGIVKRLKDKTTGTDTMDLRRPL